MKELTFLKKLKEKGIIKLVEPSEEMKSSYLIKAENCLKSAKILFQSQLYENSTSEAYYCMYNSLLSLLFKIGIKSENHSVSIILCDILRPLKVFCFAKNPPSAEDGVLTTNDASSDFSHILKLSQNRCRILHKNILHSKNG